MKKAHKLFFLFLSLILGIGCAGESDSFNQNNWVPNVLVNKTINLNAADGNPLLVPGGSAAFYDIGYKGVLVYNRDGSRFLAFDLACPHLDPSTCADPMDWESNWPEIKCACGDEEVIYYSERPYANYKGRTYEMEAYKVTRLGNTLQIRNF
ncbi:MAG: hypothetical protein P8Q27_04285 [Flavicella sp.]|nr:hypothetical protein [Flavicella sp.]